MRRYEVTIKLNDQITTIEVQARDADHALGVAAEANPWAIILTAKAL